jgi:hypothetical protein
MLVVERDEPTQANVLHDNAAEPVTVVPDRPSHQRASARGSAPTWIAGVAACLVALLWVVRAGRDEHDLTAGSRRIALAPTLASGPTPARSATAPELGASELGASELRTAQEDTRKPRDAELRAASPQATHDLDHHAARPSPKPRASSSQRALDSRSLQTPDEEASATLVVRPQVVRPQVVRSQAGPTPASDADETLALGAADTPVGARPSGRPTQPDPLAHGDRSTVAAAPVAPADRAAPPSRPPSTKEPAPEAQPIKLLDQARLFDLEVKGSLATSQVRRGVDRTKREQRACYRAATRSSLPTDLNELTVEIEIDERGRARSARVTGDAPVALKGCIEKAAQRISVAPPDTGTVVASWKVSVLP